MRLEARKYLSDIQVALERIRRFTNSKRFKQALSRLSQDSPSIAAQIPEHRKIIGFRNILVDKLLGTR